MSRLLSCVLGLLTVFLIASCAPTKTLSVWKADDAPASLQKVLVVAVLKTDYLRNQFENLLADRLAARGINVVSSNTIFPDLGPDSDRDAALAKVVELGFDSVLVSKPIHSREVTNYQQGGIYFAPAMVYPYGWYGFYSGPMVSMDRVYDTEHVTMVTSLFDVAREDETWSYVASVRVEESPQAAVEEFVPMIDEQLAASKLVP